MAIPFTKEVLMQMLQKGNAQVQPVNEELAGILDDYVGFLAKISGSIERQDFALLASIASRLYVKTIEEQQASLSATLSIQAAQKAGKNN